MNLPAFNPVALKELRQLTRTRLVGLVLIGFPALLFMISAICLSASSRDRSPIELIYGAGRGEAPFTAVAITTAITTAIIIPLIASTKTATETAKDRQGLEFTTTLTPSQIVNGKILAPLLLATALIAISMPFLAFAYLLRGVTLSYVFMVPLATLLTSIGEITFGLPAALTRRATMPLRTLGVISAIPITLIATAAFSDLFSDSSWAMSFGIPTAIIAITSIFMRGLAIQQISPPFGDIDRPLRITTAILVVLSAGFFLIDDFKPWIWSLLWALCGGTLFIRSCFTFREMPRTVRRNAPRSLLARLASYPFATGPAAGQLFAFIMLCISILPMLIAAGTSSDDDGLVLAVGLAEIVAVAWVVSGLLRHRAKGARAFHAAQVATILYLIVVNIGSAIIHDAARGTGFDVLFSVLPCNFHGLTRLFDAESPMLVVNLFVGLVLMLTGATIFAPSVRREFSAYRRHD